MALLGLTLLSGCGYTVGARLPGNPRTISVPIAFNETRYREAEVTYTRELTRELIRRTSVRLAGSEAADARLETRIIEIPRFPLIEDRTDAILEDAVLVRVSVRLIDAGTGSDLMPPFEIARRAERIVPRGETLETAIDEALRDVARETVLRLESHDFLVREPS